MLSPPTLWIETWLKLNDLLRTARKYITLCLPTCRFWPFLTKGSLPRNLNEIVRSWIRLLFHQWSLQIWLIFMLVSRLPYHSIFVHRERYLCKCCILRSTSREKEKQNDCKNVFYLSTLLFILSTRWSVPFIKNNLCYFKFWSPTFLPFRRNYNMSASNRPTANSHCVFI